jgi:hypothetical protein
MRILLWTMVIGVELSGGTLGLPVLAGALLVVCAEAHPRVRRGKRLAWEVYRAGGRDHQPPDRKQQVHPIR